jgi:hypothetical protein
MDVIDAIAQVATGSKTVPATGQTFQDVPIEPVVIEEVRIDPQ